MVVEDDGQRLLVLCSALQLLLPGAAAETAQVEVPHRLAAPGAKARTKARARRHANVHNNPRRRNQLKGASIMTERALHPATAFSCCGGHQGKPNQVAYPLQHELGAGQHFADPPAQRQNIPKPWDEEARTP